MVTESDPAAAVDAVAEKGGSSGAAGDTPGTREGKSIEERRRQRDPAGVVGWERGKEEKALKVAMAGKILNDLDSEGEPNRLGSSRELGTGKVETGDRRVMLKKI